MARPPWLQRALAAAVLLGSGACGAKAPPPEPEQELVLVPATPPSFEVEVGTGNIELEPITDGAAVDIIRGAQGGWHIWTGFRVRGAALGDVRVNLFTRFDDGSAAGDPSAVFVKLARGQDEQSTSGLRNFIRDGNDARGRRIRLRVEVVAPDGRHGEGERTVVGR